MWGCLGIWISKILGFRNWKTGNWRSHIPPLFHWTAASRAMVCSVSTFLSRNPQKHCTVVNQTINQPTNQPTIFVGGIYTIPKWFMMVYGIMFPTLPTHFHIALGANWPLQQGIPEIFVPGQLR
jgi:hypothetical protein